MVNSSGFALQPAINIPENTTSLSIGLDGTVSAVIAGESESTALGTILLTNFVNPVGLQALGGNLFAETAASGGPQQGTPGLQGLGTLIQGSVETSNVNVVEEMVSMIETQRAYEINSKAIATADGMLQYLNTHL